MLDSLFTSTFLSALSREILGKCEELLRKKRRCAGVFRTCKASDVCRMGASSPGAIVEKANENVCGMRLKIFLPPICKTSQ